MPYLPSKQAASCVFAVSSPCQAAGSEVTVRSVLLAWFMTVTQPSCSLYDWNTCLQACTPPLPPKPSPHPRWTIIFHLSSGGYRPSFSVCASQKLYFCGVSDLNTGHAAGKSKNEMPYLGSRILGKMIRLS